MGKGLPWYRLADRTTPDFSVFETNQNTPERILRFLVALVLLPAPLLAGVSAYTVIAAVVGAILAFNAVTGTCLTYRMFGVSTCRLPESDA